jgi:cell fate regulator YaaT (PSP1 superfamily)
MDESTIEVIFRTERIGYYQNPKQFTLQPDDIVICKVDRGEDIARVINTSILPDEMEESDLTGDIIRLATKEDLEKLDIVRQKEDEAKETFINSLAKYSFEMKLLEVVYQFDGNKLIFFFSADGRIDFRDFVRELANTFKTRIELHQSSGREDARRYGGYGICGKGYCCVGFLKKFNQVTIKMARDQNLISNLSKISGPCGRLLCCLHYEEDFYREKATYFPNINEEIIMDGKKLQVIKNDFYTDIVHLLTPNGNTELMTLIDFNKHKDKMKQKKLPEDDE